jgi:hypothetical protein
MKIRDENNTKGAHQNKNQRIKLVFSPETGPQGNFNPSFEFA